jgi:hypothetical protein
VTDEDRDDELIANMFDDVTVTPTRSDGEPVSDFNAACEAFVKAQRRFDQ